MNPLVLRFGSPVSSGGGTIYGILRDANSSGESIVSYHLDSGISPIFVLVVKNVAVDIGRGLVLATGLICGAFCRRLEPSPCCR